MINARVETVAERPAFSAAFERFRCLIIADGFYEWRAGCRRGPKQAFHITRDDGEPVRVRRACGRSGTRRRGEQAATVHDPHDRGQLGDRAASRPDAGDPRARRRGRRGWTPPPRPHELRSAARRALPLRHGRCGRSARPSTTPATTDPSVCAAPVRARRRPCSDACLASAPLPPARSYDHVLLDLDGCVWVGDTCHARRAGGDRRAARRRQVG